MKNGQSLLALIAIVIGVSIVWQFSSGDDRAVKHEIDSSPSIDFLMGNSDRAKHAEHLQKQILDGRIYSWQEYSAWGREIFYSGRVQQPPVGPAPSAMIPQKESFTCNRCHNNQREDPLLTEQDADARFAWLQKTQPQDVFMVQGTTLWGAVNRTSFYNGSHDVYRQLCIPDDSHPDPKDSNCDGCVTGCRTMKPENLRDALQICSKYCSVGRFLDQWESDALLAYLWDLELHLSDVELSAEEKVQIKDVLEAPNEHTPVEVQLQREILSKSYLRTSNATRRSQPSEAIGNVAAGQEFFKISCNRCHRSAGKWMINPLSKYHNAIDKGIINENKPYYMPQFTAQRMSNQQVADLLEYAKIIKK